jgi:hypothetical protein
LGKLERLEIILFNALAFFIHKSKNRATTAIIQITRLLEKLERLEIKDLILSALMVLILVGLLPTTANAGLPSSYINPRLEQPLSSFKSHAFW